MYNHTEVHSQDLSSRTAFLQAYSAAESAWFAGDFRSAVAILEDAAPHTSIERTDCALLLSRALLRLGEAERALRCARATHGVSDTDRVATSLLLQGAALSRLQRFDEARSALDEVRGLADVHRTIIAEAALETARLAYVQRGRVGPGALKEARKWALESVGRADDIVLARAQEMLGYVNLAEERYAAATRSFRQTLVTLVAAKRRDQLLEANVLHIATALAFERLEVDALPQVREALARLTWSQDVNPAHFQVSQNVGWLALVVGEEEYSWRCFQEALDSTRDDPAYRAMALTNLSSLYRVVGDPSAAKWSLSAAREIVTTIDFAALDGDRRPAFLEWVIESARQGIRVSPALIQSHAKLPTGSGERALDGGDRRARALLLTARGLAFGSDQPDRALRALRTALDIWLGTGYRFRAATTAMDMYRLFGKSEYLDVARAQTRGVRGSAWLRRMVTWEMRNQVSGAGKLTNSELRVLDKMLSGMTNEQIAQDSGRAYQTIKNQARMIFEKLKVDTRAELFVRCAELGLFKTD